MKSQFPTPAHQPFLSRIRDHLPELQRAEHKLATFLLDFAGDVASYDAQELAQLSGVSKATVSRFVRRIGFESFEAARRAARSERQAGTRHFTPLGSAIGATEPPMQTLTALNLGEEWENIAWTFERIDPDSLDSLATALLKARRVWLIGHRISHSYASMLYWQLSRVVPDMRVIPQAGEQLGDHLALLHADDLVLCLALSPRPSVIEAALQEVLMTGASCAVISDESMPDDPRFAWHFRGRIETPTPPPDRQHDEPQGHCGTARAPAPHRGNQRQVARHSKCDNRLIAKALPAQKRRFYR